MAGDGGIASGRKIRAIGVCNFYPDRLLTDLCLNAQVIPAVNQVELHPFFAQTAAIDNMKVYGVQPEAWRPLAQGEQTEFFRILNWKQSRGKYGKTVAQIVLRWNVQRGVVVIPKSVHKERMVENMNIYGIFCFERRRYGNYQQAGSGKKYGVRPLFC